MPVAALPLLPEWVNQTTTFYVFLALILVTVVIVVARYGANRLVR